jgi:hypothetical protein
MKTSLKAMNPKTISNGSAKVKHLPTKFRGQQASLTGAFHGRPKGHRMATPFSRSLRSLEADGFGRSLRSLGLMERGEVVASRVERVPQAYPIPQAGQDKAYALTLRHLDGLANLRIIGRTGRFQYLNMDEAMREGLDAAAAVAGAEAEARPLGKSA